MLLMLIFNYFRFILELCQILSSKLQAILSSKLQAVKMSISKKVYKIKRLV